MRLLGIETSCDETAAAVVDSVAGVLSNVVHSQVEMHALYGGVVPELASRAHIRNIGPVIAAALRQADTPVAALDGVAVTAGPGLVGALLTGVAAAKGLALATGLPLLGIHHMEGHLISPLLEDPDAGDAGIFPFIGLLVSGGHTLLVHAAAFGVYRLLGQSLDDAVGEAFDKGATLLGLGYPGGPAISRLAEGGDPAAFAFPRALRDKSNPDFSFSGLKTSLRLHLTAHVGETGEFFRRDTAASYQEAIVEVLTNKSLAACRREGVDRLLVAGGVGANQRLRGRLAERAAAVGVTVRFPALSLCTDNGAMIALAGLRRLQRGQHSAMGLNARPRWGVEEADAALDAPPRSAAG
ncbi:MAG: tRNA (adenosine(37)-N6)-threonylcarbamoyltransferase complex transferase subunit TsaD [Magnetococcales bacterium]|nr:tRNA (adenosine(37)-N6)-threonylcarbamoyltransferase complex transferase subunit TsaD [Magnetococcales bacterium]